MKFINIKIKKKNYAIISKININLIIMNIFLLKEISKIKRNIFLEMNTWEMTNKICLV